jgi:hypothetical protein
MGLQTADKPRAVELLQIALGGMAGLLVGALAGAAAFQSEIVALAGGLAGAVFGLIAALKYIEGEDGRGRQENLAVAQAPVGSDLNSVKPPGPDAVRQAGVDPRLPGRSAA